MPLCTRYIVQSTRRLKNVYPPPQFFIKICATLIAVIFYSPHFYAQQRLFHSEIKNIFARRIFGRCHLLGLARRGIYEFRKLCKWRSRADFRWRTRDFGPRRARSFLYRQVQMDL